MLMSLLFFVTLTACTSRGSVSVFQVGIGFSLYRSVFFSTDLKKIPSRFGICWRYFKISWYRFGIFGISLCVKAPRAHPTILLQN